MMYLAALAAALAAIMAPPTAPNWHDLQVLDRCGHRPDSCAWLSSSPELIEAVGAVESGGKWWAVRDSHLGKFQIGTRFSRMPWPALFVPALAELEARRQLDGWLEVAGGNVRRGLAGYRCGYAGSRGRCGDKYAAAVLAQLSIIADR